MVRAVEGLAGNGVTVFQQCLAVALEHGCSANQCMCTWTARRQVAEAGQVGDATLDGVWSRSRPEPTEQRQRGNA